MTTDGNYRIGQPVDTETIVAVFRYENPATENIGHSERFDNGRRDVVGENGGRPFTLPTVLESFAIRAPIDG